MPRIGICARSSGSPGTISTRPFERSSGPGSRRARAGGHGRAAQLQLAACIGLIGPLTAQNRPEPELRDIFEEGCTLAQELDDRAALLALYVLQGIHAQRSGDLEEHERLLAEARRVAPEDDATSRFVLALQSGLSLSKRGEAHAALQELDSVADLDLPTIEAGGGERGRRSPDSSRGLRGVLRGPRWHAHPAGPLRRGGAGPGSSGRAGKAASPGRRRDRRTIDTGEPGEGPGGRSRPRCRSAPSSLTGPVGSEAHRGREWPRPAWEPHTLLAGDARAAVEALERGLATCQGRGRC